MDYRIEAEARSSKDGNQIIVSVGVDRSDDGGETFARISNFEHRYSKEVTNVAIIEDIKRRLKEFIRADSNEIASAAISERASNIADALSGIRISI